MSNSPSVAGSTTASPIPTFAFRAQKQLGLVDGPPVYSPTNLLSPSLSSAAKICRFDRSGKLFGYIVGSVVHVVPVSPTVATGHARLKQGMEVVLDIPGVIDLGFSPLGNYLYTWERLTKVEDGQAGHKNLKIWWLAEPSSGSSPASARAILVGAFVQKNYNGWEPQMTVSESHLVRLSSGSEISIFTLPQSSSVEISSIPNVNMTTASDATSVESLVENVKPNSDYFGLSTPSSRVRYTDGATIKDIQLGPPSGRNTVPGSGTEGLAIWIGEYKGSPASMSLYTLRALMDAATISGGVATSLPPTNARKNFFFGDKVNVKWNKTGTMALFFTQSDVDNSGKSYYGETNLYLIGLNGQFECKVALDKDGPIYDYDWNPNSNDFAVVYGFMPARTVLFDTKANPVHSFGPQPRNFLSYQPQGQLFLSAGFGNLTGTIDIWDLKTRKKVAEWSAPNSTTCEWSPCGRYILTGTLSPRLRVDNGVKVWWCAGGLLHVQPIEELYQTLWRPSPVESMPPFPTPIPAAPAPSQSVAQHAPASAAPTPKPAGAYRPPGARGTLTPTIYKREDEGGSPSPSNALAANAAANGRPNGAVSPGAAGMRTPRVRHIPGAPPPGSDPNGTASKDDGKKNKKNKKKKGPGGDDAAGLPSIELTQPVIEESTSAADLAAAPEAEAIQKKVRNLTKKLNAINELKEKRSKGEPLEATQVKKIEGEAGIKDEISQLESKLRKALKV